ncbi:hypothetical protein G6F35_014954 [Rhizopus arrhizus]|nr:hypothetical protein G6F35_014954 [Rhizopus arrhizus]
MQQPARHRIEEGLGAFRLAVVAQQTDEFLLDLLPVGRLGVGQGRRRCAIASVAVEACRAQRALGAAAQYAFQLGGAFTHPHVVVLDAFARQVLDAVPVAGFEQGLGALRAVAKQRVVAVEPRQDQPRDVQRRGPRGGGLLDMLDIGHADHDGDRMAGQAVSLNSSRPISMRRISLVPAPISYSLASRHRRPTGYSLM